MEVLEALKALMWITAISTLIVTVVLGVILAYHWNKYSGNPSVARLSLLVYAVGALIPIFWMFGSIPL
jgi:uncharacterized membrane protein YoaK (UPF0700 family)